MFYFEVTAADTSSVRQQATTTALGPFVVEAANEDAARMLVGINYATGRSATSYGCRFRRAHCGRVRRWLRAVTGRAMSLPNWSLFQRAGWSLA